LCRGQRRWVGIGIGHCGPDALFLFLSLSLALALPAAAAAAAAAGHSGADRCCSSYVRLCKVGWARRDTVHARGRSCHADLHPLLLALRPLHQPLHRPLHRRRRRRRRHRWPSSLRRCGSSGRRVVAVGRRVVRRRRGTLLVAVVGGRSRRAAALVKPEQAAEATHQ
jgi:hypothetical protein